MSRAAALAGSVAGASRTGSHATPQERSMRIVIFFLFFLSLPCNCEALEGTYAQI